MNIDFAVLVGGAAGLSLLSVWVGAASERRKYAESVPEERPVRDYEVSTIHGDTLKARGVSFANDADYVRVKDENGQSVLLVPRNHVVSARRMDETPDGPAVPLLDSDA